MRLYGTLVFISLGVMLLACAFAMSGEDGWAKATGALSFALAIAAVTSRPI